MTPKCNQCGSDMPNDERFCRECGAENQSLQSPDKEPNAAPPAVQAENTDTNADNIFRTDPAANLPEESAPQAKAKREKRQRKPLSRKAVIMIVAITAIGIAIAALWTPISVFLFPKLALTQAFVNTRKDLNERFEGTPFALIRTAYDSTGQNTIHLSADYYDNYLGTITASGTVQTDTTAREASVSVGVEAFNRPFFINTFMDADKMAINCQQLTDARYYGIVYDTFAEDLRNNQVLYNFLGEERVSQVDSYLKIIDTIMSPEQNKNADGSSTGTDAMEILKSYILELNPKPGMQTISLDGTERHCYTMTVTMSEAEFGKLLEDTIHLIADDTALEHAYVSQNSGAGDPGWGSIIDSAQAYAQELQHSGEGSVTFVFYLYSNRIVKAEVTYTSLGAGHDGTGSVNITLGENPVSDDIILSAESNFGNDIVAVDARLNTNQEDALIREALGITLDQNGERTVYTLDYSWSSIDGALWISAGYTAADLDTPVSFQMNGRITALENGFEIQLPEFGSYLAAYQAAKKGREPKELNCVLTLSITAGCEIAQPEFIDLASMNAFQIYELISGLVF